MMKQILLADDDGDDRLLFEEIFSHLYGENFELKQVTNGQEVIDYLNNPNNLSRLPALIILDHNMPNVTGEQALMYIKAQARLANIPVVVYSTSVFGPFVENCRQHGAIDVIEKPRLYKQYQDMVAQLMALVN